MGVLARRYHPKEFIRVRQPRATPASVSTCISQVLDTKWDESLHERALKEAVENWALAFPGEVRGTIFLPQ